MLLSATARCLKKEENKTFVLSGGFFQNNNKFREENVFKTMKKERNEENNIRLLYNMLG